uniref:Phosphoinositide phospholipase C n=1 Tax=Rhipicephalus appendiculatus TaxID=34631 RepID=A0A131YWX8_RHIAP
MSNRDSPLKQNNVPPGQKVTEARRGHDDGCQPTNAASIPSTSPSKSDSAHTPSTTSTSRPAAAPSARLTCPNENESFKRTSSSPGVLDNRSVSSGSDDAVRAQTDDALPTSDDKLPTKKDSELLLRRSNSDRPSSQPSVPKVCADVSRTLSVPAVTSKCSSQVGSEPVTGQASSVPVVTSKCSSPVRRKHMEQGASRSSPNRATVSATQVQDSACIDPKTDKPPSNGISSHDQKPASQNESSNTAMVQQSSAAAAETPSDPTVSSHRDSQSSVQITSDASSIEVTVATPPSGEKDLPAATKLDLCGISASVNSVACSSDSDSHESAKGSLVSTDTDSALRVQFTASGGRERRDSSGTLSLNQAQMIPKSVSFHSGTSLPAERKICSAHDCLQFMITGSSLLKIRASSRQYRRYFTLEEDLTAIKWVPSSKKSNKARLSIRSIREIRIGKSTDVLRDKEVAGCYSEDCVFSVIYGDDFESLDLVASTPDEANFWVTGLNMLIAANRSPDNLDERQRMREKWLQEMFEKADTERKGLLDEVETIALVQKLNSQLSVVRLKQKMMEFDVGKTEQDRGRIDRSQFVSLFKELATRPEVYFLMVRYSGKDYLTVEDLQFFLEGEQEFENITVDDCLRLIQRYEPSEEAKKNKQMLLDGFTLFLLSDECSLMDQAHKKVFQDMNQPLCHYFISSSHNTYLMEDQLKGPSSIDGYTQALSQGCRVVKVDCWSSSEGPVVFHGNTLTGRVPLSAVLDTIREHAFQVSDYPLILHLENHCSPEAQEELVSLLMEKLGDLLYVPGRDGEEFTTKLSPQSLKRKIIIKSKKLPKDSEEAEISEEDDFVDKNSNSSESPKKLKLIKPLSDLVVLSRIHFTDFATSQQSQAENEVCTFSETSALKLGHALADEVAAHTRHFLAHVSPTASRVDSSNYNPLELWACGFQMAAMNVQTSGVSMDLHRGWFQQNGSSGYVLKPPCLRQPWSVFNAYRRETFSDNEPLYLRVKIISGQQLPLPRGASSKATAIDPYVTVQVFGIPTDCAEARTKTVSNEGHSPIFDECFEFTVAAPELAVLRFAVLDDEFIGDDFIGQHSIPVSSLKTGYRHVQLTSDTGKVLENSSLFLHVTMSTRSGDKKLRRKRSWQTRPQAEMRHVGIRHLDEAFKGAAGALNECQRLKGSLDRAMLECCEECGLPSSANLAQCLRAAALRLASASEVVGISIVEEKGYPVFKVQGEPSVKASKLVTAFDKVLAECKAISETSHSVFKTLNELYQTMKSFSEDLNGTCAAVGLKGKKAEKAAEHFLWNASIVESRMDMLRKVDKESRACMKQVLRLGQTARRLYQREREGSSSRTQSASSSTGSTLSPPGANTLGCPHPPPPTPTSPGGSDTRIRGILKKTSNHPPPLSSLEAVSAMDNSNGGEPPLTPSPSPRVKQAPNPTELGTSL